MTDLLTNAAARSARYLAGIPKRRVAPLPQDIARLDSLAGPLPQSPTDPAEVLALLDDIGSPATVATTGGRYFGFVIGGALPVALAANWLAAAWDQNAAYTAMSPVAARLEEIVLSWICDLLHLPPASGAAFVTGTTVSHFAALAAARSALLRRQDWNVEDDGLFGAPPITVIVGEEVHVSLLKALAMLGLGHSRVIKVACDAQGRMRPDALPNLDASTLLCIQSGNVNTGAFDPAQELCAAAHQAGAWVHVDGAFGLWAAASPQLAHLVQGVGEADSWAIDCHKWLNVPYDSGLAVVREPEHLRAAFTTSAAYLQADATREPCHYTPESSRRARAVDLWAALRSLGRDGLRELIERNCRQARHFAEGLRRAGFDVLNDVILNQVMVSFGSPAETQRVIREVQSEGTCWCGPTNWHGHTAMRISVSSWVTTDADVEQSLAAILRIARRT
ncbi:MAG TPA: aminotransferase class V-fold PLP-dependent enzyme [Candidatus Acidoferrum sp.]|nr:aminotransferase class V-fold PLP-dependent enzyme [Candidatus Acidoferrum sp.]